MDNTHKIILIYITAIFLTANTSFVHATEHTDDIDAVDKNGRVTDTFVLDQNVYISGECSDVPGKSVNIYITSNKNSWDEDDELIDISNSIETVQVDSDNQIPLTKIWGSDLDIGKFDVVVDVNKNSYYDENTDCIDGASNEGFKVISSGSGTAKEGSKNPNEHFEWKIESENPFVTLLQVRISLDNEEDATITSFEIQGSGSGSDRNSIIEVIVADDRNNDGEYNDGSDLILGKGVYDHNNGKAIVNTSTNLGRGESENIVIAYLLGKDLGNGDIFVAKLTDIDATGIVSNGELRFEGLPITSVQIKIKGSGDAIEVDQPIDLLENTIDSNNSNGEVSPNYNSINGSNGSLLASLFSFNDEPRDTSDKPWVPPLGLRVTFISMLGLIGLNIIWKVIRGIFRMFI